MLPCAKTVPNLKWLQIFFGERENITAEIASFCVCFLNNQVTESKRIWDWYKKGMGTGLCLVLLFTGLGFKNNITFRKPSPFLWVLSSKLGSYWKYVCDQVQNHKQTILLCPVRTILVSFILFVIIGFLPLYTSLISFSLKNSPISGSVAFWLDRRLEGHLSTSFP